MYEEPLENLFVTLYLLKWFGGLYLRVTYDTPSVTLVFHSRIKLAEGSLIPSNISDVDYGILCSLLIPFYQLDGFICGK